MSKISPHIRRETQSVPPVIQESHRQVVLGIDILNVNKTPFLITISRGLHFGTAEYITDPTIKSVSDALLHVINYITVRDSGLPP